jgi:glycosyltransferase involved in cell wall biosynthesis
MNKTPARRLIFVNRFFYPDLSATSQILFDLARRLVESGIEVHVVCSQQLYENPQASLASSETVAGVHAHRIRTTRFGRARLLGRAVDYLSFYASAALCLLRLSRSTDILIAKTDPPLISIVVMLIARLRGATLINWLQDIFPEVASYLDAAPLPATLDAVLRRLRDASLHAARLNVVLGSRMYEYIASRGIGPKRIRIIENWADADVIEPIAPAASRCRQALGLSKRFVVGYSGNLGRAHDYRTILDAASKLASEKEIAFLMTGGGTNMTRLRDEATSRGLTNLIFQPYQPRERLSDSLSAADVHMACLLPALEGLIVPSKFYGILAVGRPVLFIGDPDGELARIIRLTRCGAVVPCGDSTALATAIIDLKTAPDEVREQGGRARRLFVETYTADRAADQWRSMLSELGLKFTPGAGSMAQAGNEYSPYGRSRPLRDCNEQTLRCSSTRTTTFMGGNEYV